MTLSQHLLELLPITTLPPFAARIAPETLSEKEIVQATCSTCRINLSAEIKLRSLPCGHLLHESCASSMIIDYSENEYKMSCPLCKAAVFPKLVLRSRRKRQQQQPGDAPSARRKAFPTTTSTTNPTFRNSYLSNQMEGISVNGKELASCFKHLDLSTTVGRPTKPKRIPGTATTIHNSTTRPLRQTRLYTHEPQEDALNDRLLVNHFYRRGQSAPVGRVSSNAKAGEDECFLTEWWDLSLYSPITLFRPGQIKIMQRVLLVC